MNPTFQLANFNPLSRTTQIGNLTIVISRYIGIWSDLYDTGIDRPQTRRLHYLATAVPRLSQLDKPSGTNRRGYTQMFFITALK